MSTAFKETVTPHWIIIIIIMPHHNKSKCR